MPRRQTMATWITRAQQLVDLENDDSIEPAVWKWFASMVYGELWSEVSNGAGRYFETSYSFTADGSASYSEPEGHYSTVRVARVDASGREYPLRQLRQQDEAARKGITGSDACAYTLVDDQLFLYPTPSSGDYKWYYLQQPTDISSYADDDVVDVVAPAGEAFFLWGIGMLALQRQQKNVQLAMTEKERARGELQFWAAQRHFYEPHQRLADDDDGDVRLPGDWEPWG